MTYDEILTQAQFTRQGPPTVSPLHSSRYEIWEGPRGQRLKVEVSDKLEQDQPDYYLSETTAHGTRAALRAQARHLLLTANDVVIDGRSLDYLTFFEHFTVGETLEGHWDITINDISGSRSYALSDSQIDVFTNGLLAIEGDGRRHRIAGRRGAAPYPAYRSDDGDLIAWGLLSDADGDHIAMGNWHAHHHLD